MTSAHDGSRRLGAGAGFAGDRLDPALDLVQRGKVARVVPETVAAHFCGLDPARVTVVALPALGAVVLTLQGRLAGEVTRSTGLDPHGKTLTGHLLDLELTLPDVPGRTENENA